jgi:hypothetical protein
MMLHFLPLTFGTTKVLGSLIVQYTNVHFNEDFGVFKQMEEFAFLNIDWSVGRLEAFITRRSFVRDSIPDKIQSFRLSSLGCGYE